jgi:glycine/sarcosine N-methyltransferase
LPLYETLGERYDVMVDWDGRLKRESPFFEQQFQEARAKRLLDLGCGTGWHAAHFGRLGYEVVGADPSPALLEVARRTHGRIAGLSFVEAGFGQVRERVKGGFDAVYCVGNTLPHVRDLADLANTLADVAVALRPDGVLIVQQLNYDAIVARRQRFLPLGSRTVDGTDYLFFRFYDFGADRITFNMAVMRRGQDGWQYDIDSTDLLPVGAAELSSALGAAGFDRISLLGSYAGEPFDPETSGDLVVVARRASA